MTVFRFGRAVEGGSVTELGVGPESVSGRSEKSDWSACAQFSHSIIKEQQMKPEIRIGLKERVK